MPRHQRLRVLVGLGQLTLFDPVGDQPGNRKDVVGIKGDRPFQGCVRALAHGVAAVRIGGIVVVTNSEIGPGGRVGGVQPHGALQHGNRIFVGNRIMRQRDTAEIEIVCFFVLWMCASFT